MPFYNKLLSAVLDCESYYPLAIRISYQHDNGSILLLYLSFDIYKKLFKVKLIYPHPTSIPAFGIGYVLDEYGAN